MATLQPIDQDLFFNLSIDEVRLLSKYRELAQHQQRGIQQAVEILKPSRAGNLQRWGHRSSAVPADAAE